MLVYTNAKICVTPNQNPNASQWNIGCVGSQTQNSRVGHVHFIFLGVDFIRIETRFSVEYGLKSVKGAHEIPLADNTSIVSIFLFLFRQDYDPRPLNLTGRHGHFLKSTCDLEENKRQRHVSLRLLKIYMRHGDPPPKAP